MPYQAFRMRLVNMINKMLEILETNEEFDTFYMDGQTVVLEDYLEIYPENRGRIENLIKKGKLVVGPWYVMPDEMLLSGESYIKNLQKGFKIARSFGAEPMKFGYLCDMFGHNAQMPQILKGMGIDNALLGRGANDHTTPMHFVWEGISGDGVVTFKLQDSAGYGAFQIKVLRPLSNTDYTEEQVRNNLKGYIDEEIERANIPILLLTDGDDHAYCRADTAYYLDMIRELYPEAEVVHGKMDEFCEEINAFEAELPCRLGEIIEPTKKVADYSFLLTNCLSSRYPIKKKNDEMQTMLEKVIEPLYVLGKIDNTYRFIDLANTYLLKNHAHDTICGCSIDEVHRDMMTRLGQAEAICAQLFNGYWDSRHKEKATENIAVEILNPLPYNDTRTVEVEIFFPRNWPTKFAEHFGYEWTNSFKLYDENENEIPYGISAVKKNSMRRYHDVTFCVYDVYTVTFEAELKAMKANRFIVKPCSTAQRYLDVMNADENSAENEFLKISFDARGLLNIKDKINNREYTGLLETVDNCEIGDGWNHGSCINDYTVSNTLESITIKEKSYARTAFEVTQKLVLPQRVLRTEHGIVRDDVKKELFVIHTVSLGRNARYVDIKTKVINNVKDHRLRLKMPTGIEADTYFVNGPFCFVERENGVDISTQDWKERSLQEKQTAGIVYVKDKKSGFSFISKSGLHECGVTENNDIYITLMRCFSRVHLHDGMPDAQLQGEQEYRYIIMPTSADTSFAQLQRRQDFLQTDGIYSNAISVELENENSDIMLSGENIVYSTLVAREDYNELRIYNASYDTSSAKIDFAQNISEACLVNLDGEIKEKLTVNNNSISLDLTKWQIATIRYKY